MSGFDKPCLKKSVTLSMKPLLKTYLLIRLHFNKKKYFLYEFEKAKQCHSKVSKFSVILHIPFYKLLSYKKVCVLITSSSSLKILISYRQEGIHKSYQSHYPQKSIILTHVQLYDVQTAVYNSGFF